VVARADERERRAELAVHGPSREVDEYIEAGCLVSLTRMRYA